MSISFDSLLTCSPDALCGIQKIHVIEEGATEGVILLVVFYTYGQSWGLVNAQSTVKKRINVFLCASQCGKHVRPIARLVI